MERKLLLDEKNNTITERGYAPTFNVIGKEINKFDNSYSATKVRDVINEFDNITINDRDFAATTFTQNNVLQKTQISARAKLYLTSSVVITALLLFLVIYNLFVISNMQNGIEMLQGEVYQQELRWDDVYKQYRNLTREESIIEELQSSGYVPANENNMFYVNLSNPNSVVELKGETNWFDALCNFISNLFGN